MVEIIQDIFHYIMHHYALYLVVTMSLITSFTIALVSLIKKPIKKLTAKITSTKIRKLANNFIMIFIAFMISWLAWFILGKISPYYFTAKYVEILLTGAFSIVLYALGDGVITPQTAKTAIGKVMEIADEEKDKNEKPKKTAVEEYLKKVK
jgi:uncharacterized protein YacL